MLEFTRIVGTKQERYQQTEEGSSVWKIALDVLEIAGTLADDMKMKVSTLWSDYRNWLKIKYRHSRAHTDNNYEKCSWIFKELNFESQEKPMQRMSEAEKQNHVSIVFSLLIF